MIQVGTYIVSVAGRRFSASDDRIARVRDQLRDAARSGGAFVTFDVRGGSIEVLVTPGLPVFIERIPDPEPESESSPELAAAGASSAETVATPMDEFDDWGI